MSEVTRLLEVANRRGARLPPPRRTVYQARQKWVFARAWLRRQLLADQADQEK